MAPATAARQLIKYLFPSILWCGALLAPLPVPAPALHRDLHRRRYLHRERNREIYRRPYSQGSPPKTIPTTASLATVYGWVHRKDNSSRGPASQCEPSPRSAHPGARRARAGALELRGPGLPGMQHNRERTRVRARALLPWQLRAPSQNQRLRGSAILAPPGMPARARRRARSLRDERLPSPAARSSFTSPSTARASCKAAPQLQPIAGLAGEPARQNLPRNRSRDRHALHRRGCRH